MIKATTEFDPCYKAKQRRVTYQRIPKPIRILVEINPGTGRKLNSALWKGLKLPVGWRKNARQAWHDDLCMPIRVQCYDPALAMTPEQLEILRAQISLMVT